MRFNVLFDARSLVEKNQWRRLLLQIRELKQIKRMVGWFFFHKLKGYLFSQLHAPPPPLSFSPPPPPFKDSKEEIREVRTEPSETCINFSYL